MFSPSIRSLLPNIVIIFGTALLVIIIIIISGQENRINGRGDPLRWPRDTLYPEKLALTSPTSGGRTKGHGV
jgi:hypothetical protein